MDGSHKALASCTSIRAVHLVHVPDTNRPRTIATSVETADSVLTRGIGLMFRRSIPDGYAMLFRFDTPRRRSVHMCFVPFAIDVLWLERERVTNVVRLDPWTGFDRGRGDTIVELPAGSADAIEVGDEVRLEVDARPR